MERTAIRDAHSIYYYLPSNTTKLLGRCRLDTLLSRSVGSISLLVV